MKTIDAAARMNARGGVVSLFVLFCGKVYLCLQVGKQIRSLFLSADYCRYSTIVRSFCGVSRFCTGSLA